MIFCFCLEVADNGLFAVRANRYHRHGNTDLFLDVCHIVAEGFGKFGFGACLGEVCLPAGQLVVDWFGYAGTLGVVTDGVATLIVSKPSRTSLFIIMR